MVTKPEFLVAKDEMLVALVTVLVTISSPGMAFKRLHLVKLVVFKRKGPNGPFLRFSGGHL